MITEFTDGELGVIRVRRHKNARGIRFRLSPKGILTASASPRTPVSAVKLAARTMRRELQSMLNEHQQRVLYQDGDTIGKSHRLSVITDSSVDRPTARVRDRLITVSIPDSFSPQHPEVQRMSQEQVIKALRKEAKVYLERRLRNLAMKHGYGYKKIRYTHTGTRWGSCSSSGTISLNIALMMLPLELIDYVLIHELCHTKEMNHSSAFWRLVKQADPQYETHRRAIKQYSPAL